MNRGVKCLIKLVSEQNPHRGEGGGRADEKPRNETSFFHLFHFSVSHFIYFIFRFLISFIFFFRFLISFIFIFRSLIFLLCLMKCRRSAHTHARHTHTHTTEARTRTQTDACVCLRAQGRALTLRRDDARPHPHTPFYTHIRQFYNHVNIACVCAHHIA